MSLRDYEVVIGLEVHAQLLTRTKIFCPCSTAFGGEPNTRTCPICLGLPGVLPALNRAAVECAVRAGLALGCEVRGKSVWARKNYFYPDLPKGYQISQYELPICEGGEVRFTFDGAERAVRLVRIHLEEDAGKNVHGVAADGSSGVDLNRAGVPLAEIVSAPDLRSAAEAVEYLRSLRAVLMYLGVNDGNLEEGSFRCDANVSVRRRGEERLGQRCELKNLNSFRFLRQAVDYEERRQVEIVESGGAVAQETRLFDPDRGETRAMRSKEDAHDYRYFPEPDLPPLVLDDAFVERLRATIPELPRARSARYVGELGLSAQDAGLLTAERGLADFFDAALAAAGGGPERAKQLSNWLSGDVARLANAARLAPPDWKLTPAMLAEVLSLVDAGVVGGPGAKALVEELFTTGGEPNAIVSAKGLGQVSDEVALGAVVDEVLASCPGEVERYRAGRKNLLGFFVGAVMKRLKGRGNPGVVNALVRRKLGE